MRHLALITGAIALWCGFDAYSDPGGAPYLMALSTGLFAGLTWVALDVARFRKIGVTAMFEVYLGRWMLLIFFTIGGPFLVLALNDPELTPLGIFVGAFALFGVVFRFFFGRIPKTATPEGRKAKYEEQRLRSLTGKLNWSGDRIEDMAAGLRMSPWPARGLLAFGGPLVATAAWGLSPASLAGAVMVCASLVLMALRAKSMPHGQSFVVPNEAPFLLSQGIGGGLQMSRPPKGGVTVSLSCVRRTLTKARDNTSAIDVEVLWENVMPLTDQAFAFRPPADLPPSKADGPVQVAWTLTATGVGYRALFRLPVEA